MNSKIASKAFTLAEVLVTLSIIGVIAAMTIPPLQSHLASSANVEAMKKAFVYISDVLELTIPHGDPYTKWDMDEETSETLYEKIKPDLTISKECINTTGCWADSTRYFNNTSAEDFTASGFSESPVSFKMADGTNISMGISEKDFNVPKENTKALVFAVDVNGDKNPNRLGDDIFLFVLGIDGLTPAGKSSRNGGNCISGGTGTDCAASIIKEGRRNY